MKDAGEGDFPGSPVVKRLRAFNVQGTGSIPGWEPRSHMPHGTAKKKKRTGEGQRARRHQGSAFESICLLPVPRAFHHLLREFFLDDMTDHKDAEYSAAKPRSLDTEARATPNLRLIRKLLNPSPPRVSLSWPPLPTQGLGPTGAFQNLRR